MSLFSVISSLCESHTHFFLTEMFNFAGHQLTMHFISSQLSASVGSRFYFFGVVVDQLSMDRGVEMITSLSDFGLVVSQRFNYVKPDYLL